MKPNLLPVFALALSCWSCGNHETKTPVELADPMVGTGFHGHTFPGATTPFGGVQLSPDTRSGNWDACSGYHYSDNTINGFSHTHLSGTGCCDLGDILFRPTSMTVDLAADTLFVPATFSHANEKATPGFYSVKLDNENILVELTATPHVGVHRYTFADGAPAQIIIDLDNSIAGDETINEASIAAVDGTTTISGHRVTSGWTPLHHVYFSTEFSRPIVKAEVVKDGHAALLTFENTGEPLVAAVGISGVSVENAEENRKAEVPVLDFEAVSNDATKLWADALDVITVEGGTPDHQKNFYTALYHTMIAPNLMSDVNGQYRRNNGEVATAPDGKFYSTMSLWDTYRAWNPLQTLVNDEFVCDMVNSMLDIYDAQGELPIWPLGSGETGCMIGRHAVSVIADAYLKGLRCFDAEKALEAMIASSNTPRKGGDLFAELGYIPSNSKRESVSCAIEYSYDDWCLARMAEAMGRNDVADEYYRRAENYLNVFDGDTGFFRGRRSDGNWDHPFNPAAVSRDLTEATPWQFRFGAQHDVNGMINAYGSVERFANAIDSIFYTTSTVEGDLSDITGLVGQYAHGNEPSHHIAYLYNYVGQPWKTQEMTRRLLDEMYQPTPEGICGNEDVGQMSAWYVLTALGLYDVAPGDGQFALTTPLFDKAVVKVSPDTTLTIIANNPAKNIYIEKVELNGKEIETNFIDFAELKKGGVLNFTLTDKPVKTRGTDIATTAPYSMTGVKRVSTPFVKEDIYMFPDSIMVSMGCATPGATVYYTLDGTVPTVESNKYESPVLITESCPVKAIAVKDGLENSPVMEMNATKITFEPAVKVASIQDGVHYTYFEGLCEKTADITRGTKIKEGTLAEPGIKEARQEDHFAFIFDGYIDVPAKGVYTFRTTTDDGSVLYIDNKLVVNNDGGHAAVAAQGSIGLEPGLHPFRLLYFEDYEGEEFGWDWKIPGSDNFTAIPVSVLKH